MRWRIFLADISISGPSPNKGKSMGTTHISFSGGVSFHSWKRYVHSPYHSRRTRMMDAIVDVSLGCALQVDYGLFKYRHSLLSIFTRIICMAFTWGRGCFQARTMITNGLPSLPFYANGKHFPYRYTHVRAILFDFTQAHKYSYAPHFIFIK